MTTQTSVQELITNVEREEGAVYAAGDNFLVQTLQDRRAAAGRKLHVVTYEEGKLFQFRVAYCGRLADRDHRASYGEFISYEESDKDYIFCITCLNEALATS